jgi:hypothetical protein
MINLTNSKVQEYRTAPCQDVIENSYVLKRVDDGYGGSAVAKATGAVGEDLVGIAHVQPIAATTRAVVGETGSTIGGKITLKHPGAVAGSVAVFNKTQNAPVAVADGALVGNVLTLTGTANTDVLVLGYRRSVTLAELKIEGLPLDFANSVNGVGGSAEFATGKSTTEVDFFDTAATFLVGEPVYSNEEGLLTAVPVDADSPVFGKVAIAPTAAYPLLGVAFDLQF